MQDNSRLEREQQARQEKEATLRDLSEGAPFGGIQSETVKRESDRCNVKDFLQS